MKIALVMLLSATLLTASGALGAAAYRTYYMHPSDRVYIDGLDIFCGYGPGTSKPAFGPALACGNTSTGNGPYVRIYGDRIDVVSSGQRLLFRVKRDR